MSADNGYILRNNPTGKFVLQHYFASAEEYPPIDDSRAMVFDTLEEAIAKYQQLEKGSYPSEYGLAVALRSKLD